MGLGCVAFNPRGSGPKAKARRELARLIADFVARGGRITRCPGFGEGRMERDDPRAKDSFFTRGHKNGGAAAKSAGARTKQYELRSSFDFEKRREIRVRFLEGETVSELGRAFHCDPGRIRTVLDEAGLRSVS